MSATIPIKPETLTAFADEARRLGGTTGELSTAEMLNTFQSTTAIKNQDITITENGTYTTDAEYTGFGTVVVEIPEGTGGGVATGTLLVASSRASGTVL